MIVDAAPPHAEGAVDVGIRYNGKEFRSNALLYYYDPSHEPEPSVFEPVLLPVLDSGSGAFGSSWATEAIMSREPSYYVVSDGSTTGDETDGFHRLPGRGFPRGAIVHVPRRESEKTHFALRLRELSRNPDAYGTELPVVREKDFVGPRMSLYDVPIGPKVRSKLRVYSLDPPKGEEGEVSVTFLRAGTNRSVQSWGLSWTRPPCTYESCMPAYAELDLDKLSWNPEIRAGGRFDLSFWTNYADAWAFITVVDNATLAVSEHRPLCPEADPRRGHTFGQRFGNDLPFRGGLKIIDRPITATIAVRTEDRRPDPNGLPALRPAPTFSLPRASRPADSG